MFPIIINLILIFLITRNLQKKLDNLKDIQAYSDEWMQLNNKIELEKSSLDRKLFTDKFYREFLIKSKSKLFIKYKFFMKYNSFILKIRYNL